MLECGLKLMNMAGRKVNCKRAANYYNHNHNPVLENEKYMKLKVQIDNMSSEFLTMLDLGHSQLLQLESGFKYRIKKVWDLNQLASEKERC